MPQVRNPKFTHPATQWARDNVAAINTWFTNRSGQEWVEFETLRTAAPALATFTDGELAEMLRELGLEVSA